MYCYRCSLCECDSSIPNAPSRSVWGIKKNLVHPLTYYLFLGVVESMLLDLSWDNYKKAGLSHL